MTATTTNDNAAIAVINDFQHRLAAKNEQIAHLTALLFGTTSSNDVREVTAQILTKGRPDIISGIKTVRLYRDKLTKLGLESKKEYDTRVEVLIVHHDPYKGKLEVAYIGDKNGITVQCDVSDLTDSHSDEVTRIFTANTDEDMTEDAL